MLPEKLQLKIFATATSSVEAEAFIPVFHRWIKEHVLPELLVDVANYAHVPEGPGVGIIGHGADYFMDSAEGRLGLVHVRKRAGTDGDRLADLARRTLHVASLLEREPSLEGKLRFETNELLFRVNDRLVAPNTDLTFTALGPELRAFAESIYGGPCELTRVGSAKELFSVRVTQATKVALPALLERAGGPPGPDASIVPTAP